MNDRELLEMAAKAIGLEIGLYYEGYGLAVEGMGVWWNPLEDDGSALRLVVSMARLDPTTPERAGKSYFCMSMNSQFVQVASGGSQAYTGGTTDLLAATRRAIVIAAAEIGRSMP